MLVNVFDVMLLFTDGEIYEDLFYFRRSYCEKIGRMLIFHAILTPLPTCIIDLAKN